MPRSVTIRPGDDVARRLARVRVTRGPVDLDAFPDFFVVGPPRTGTTWLHSQLEVHPEIFVPHPKELYFFSAIRTRAAHFVTDELADYLAFFAADLPGVAAKDAACRERYGRGFDIRARGDFSTSYAAHLDDVSIADLRLLNPELRAVLHLRDPVKRAWSHARHVLRHEGLDRTDPQVVREIVTNEYVLDCSRYSVMVPFWQRHFGDRLLITPFRRIRAEPDALLARVHAFLGVTPDPRFHAPRNEQRRNAAGGGAMPDDVRTHLEAELGGEREWLLDVFGLDPADL